MRRRGVSKLETDIMQSFLRILKYLKPYSFQVVLNFVFNILAIILSLFTFIVFIPFLKLIFGKEPSILPKPAVFIDYSVKNIKNFIGDYFNYSFYHYIQEEGKVNALFIICVVVVAIFLLKNLFRYFALYFMVHARYAVVRDIRNHLYKKILSLPLSFFKRRSRGDILSRMTSDVQEIDASLMNMLEAIVKEPITILVYLLGMIIISPQLTLFVLILLPITGLIIGRIGKTLKKVSNKGQEQLAIFMSVIEESLYGLRIIKAYNAEKFQQEKFSNENEKNFKLSTHLLRRRDLSAPLSEFLGMVVVAIVLWFGGKLILEDNSSLEAETFLVYIGIFSQIINPAKAFSSAYYHIQKGMASAERIQKILDTEETIKESANPISINTFEKAIEYKNVFFAYGDFPVIKGISFRIEKGKKIALVGMSGGGKSTLVDLLPRFYDPQQGSICIDGKDIKELKFKELRNLFGVVSQQSILFNDTVLNNITYGSEMINKEKVIEAAKAANAHDFIINLEQGYDTNIGNSGERLSGGERQRVTIARALYKNPPILILDEATSSLDAESEKLVQDALLKLMENRTSLVIAHRLATIKHADEIVVIEDGKIAEKGKHDELIQLNGVYKKLVELQSF